MRSRLAVTVLAATVMVVVAFVVPLGYLVRRIAEDREISAATSQARSIGPLLAGQGIRATRSVIASSGRIGDRSVTVVLPDDRRIGAAPHIDAAALRLARRGTAFVRSVGSGVDVYQPVLGVAGGTGVVVVHASDARLHAGVVGAWVVLGGLGVVLCAAALLVADRIARTATQALGAVATTARRLAAGEEDVRAANVGPLEVRSVAHALNLLADRVHALRTAERESLADLSHDLRTPITALRLDAELLEPSEERHRLLADVARLEAAVSGLITTARSGGVDDEDGPSDFSAIARGRLGFWSVAAREQSREFTSTIDPVAMPVRAGSRTLHALVDALMTNALQHTPRGAAIATTGCVDAGWVEFTVDDAGQGFPSGAVLERGVRGHESGGTGLGLDIARRTAVAAGGSLSIARSPLGGARVLVRMPLVAG